jgi:GH25 family lysozyme M1 (1,4-beta-N-acetylmuramidase)
VARAAIAAAAAERIASPGIVDGVEGEVDRDHFYGTVDQLRALTAPPTIA